MPIECKVIDQMCPLSIHDPLLSHEITLKRRSQGITQTPHISHQPSADACWKEPQTRLLPWHTLCPAATLSRKPSSTASGPLSSPLQQLPAAAFLAWPPLSTSTQACRSFHFDIKGPLPWLILWISEGFRALQSALRGGVPFTAPS